MNNSLPLLMPLFDALNACALCFSPFTTFDNVRSSFTKRQVMKPRKEPPERRLFRTELWEDNLFQLLVLTSRPPTSSLRMDNVFALLFLGSRRTGGSFLGFCADSHKARSTQND